MTENVKTGSVRRSLGSQPVVFNNKETDALASLVLSLLGEVMVLKDRVDANERLLEKHGLHGPADVDEFAPDDAARQHRSAYRQKIYDRVLGSGLQKLMPDLLDEQEVYEDTLDMVTKD
jgi:hypothetical protein